MLVVPNRVFYFEFLSIYLNVLLYLHNLEYLNWMYTLCILVAFYSIVKDVFRVF